MQDLYVSQYKIITLHLSGSSYSLQQPEQYTFFCVLDILFFTLWPPLAECFYYVSAPRALSRSLFRLVYLAGMRQDRFLADYYYLLGSSLLCQVFAPPDTSSFGLYDYSNALKDLTWSLATNLSPLPRIFPTIHRMTLKNTELGSSVRAWMRNLATQTGNSPRGRSP